MSNAKHTPGPWSVGPRGAAVYDSDGMRLACLDARRATLGQRAHNARLIAAAPAMLEALKVGLAAMQWMRQWITGEEDAAEMDRDIEQVSAAIAEAEGGGP